MFPLWGGGRGGGNDDGGGYICVLQKNFSVKRDIKL